MVNCAWRRAAEPFSHQSYTCPAEVGQEGSTLLFQLSYADGQSPELVGAAQSARSSDSGAPGTGFEYQLWQPLVGQPQASL